MSGAIDGRVPAFAIGLVAVGRTGPAPTLPQEGTSPALDTEPVLHVDALYAASGVDHLLDELSIPTLSDQQAVDPATYVAALDRARQVLRVMPGSVVAAASAVLDELAADRDILDMAQRSLVRG